MFRQNSGRLPLAAPFLTIIALGAALAFVGCGGTSSASNAPTPPASPQQGNQQQNPVRTAQGLINQGKFAEAETLLANVVEQNPQAPLAWMLLGYARHAQGKLDEALKAHLKAAEFPQVKGNALYNAACVYSLKGDVDKSIETLKLAVEAGFADRANMSTDKDLENARQDVRFAAILPALLEGKDLFVEPTRIIHTLVGERANDEFGWEARRIGDVDGDGVIDFVTSSPGYANHSGKIYVYSSREAKLLYERQGSPGQRYGTASDRAGDVNKDGTPDVIVGAPQAGAGTAEVLSGKDGSVLLTLKGEEAGGQFGQRVAELGDINGDGFADVAITALVATGKAAQSGRCFGFSGKDGSQLFVVDGEESGDKFGSSLAASADPQHPLLVVGAQDAGEADRGRIYVYKLEGVTPQLAFTIDTSEGGKDLGQGFASFPGDLNQDGTPDVFVVDFTDSSGGPGTGRFFVYSCADGKKLLDVKGTHPGEMLGTSISDAGDVDGDGVGDLVVGAWQNREAAQSAGKVYLYSGASGKELAAWTCRQTQDTFGFDAQGIGDVDGDDHVDFLLTSAWSPARGAKTGRVFVIAGEDWKAKQK